MMGLELSFGFLVVALFLLIGDVALLLENRGLVSDGGRVETPPTEASFSATGRAKVGSVILFLDEVGADAELDTPSTFSLSSHALIERFFHDLLLGDLSSVLVLVVVTPARTLLAMEAMADSGVLARSTMADET